MPLNGVVATVHERFGLRLRPWSALQLEAGSSGNRDARSWFGRFRFSIPLGGSA